MDHFSRGEVSENKDPLSPSGRRAIEEDLEDDDEASATSRIGSANSCDHQTKEISAPYTVPHYPIELEEQKKIAAQLIVLKELEERATQVSEEAGESHSYFR